MERKVIYAIDDPYEELFEMANLTPQKTGLKVDIWSEHRGFKRNKKDKGQRIKIAYNDDYSVSVSIEKSPEILSVSSSLRSKKEGSPEWKAIKDGIKYVGRNSDLFLKHYNDDEKNKFDDEALFNALRERGEYK